MIWQILQKLTVPPEYNSLPLWMRNKWKHSEFHLALTVAGAAGTAVWEMKYT